MNDLEIVLDGFKKVENELKNEFNKERKLFESGKGDLEKVYYLQEQLSIIRNYISTLKD